MIVITAEEEDSAQWSAQDEDMMIAHRRVYSHADLYALSDLSGGGSSDVDAEVCITDREQHDAREESTESNDYKSTESTESKDYKDYKDYKEYTEYLFTAPGMPDKMRRSGPWRFGDYFIMRALDGPSELSERVRANHNGPSEPQCFLAVCKTSHMSVVLKRYRGGNDIDALILEHAGEIMHQGGTVHSNILRLYAAFSEGPFLYLVEELAARGNLTSMLDKRVEEAVIKRIVRSVLRALAHLHSKGIAHCAVLPRNVYLCGDDDHGEDRFALGGFGASMRSRIAAADDVYAVGVLTYELLAGSRMPAVSVGAFACTFLDTFTDAACDFIVKCWVSDPSLRPSAAELQGHEFLKSTASTTSLLSTQIMA